MSVKVKSIYSPGQSHNCTFTHSTFSHFSKVLLCDHTFCRTFLKCNCGIALFVAVLKSVTKSAIAQLHFWKEQQMCKNSANFWMCKRLNEQGWTSARFENVQSPYFKSKKCDLEIALFCTFLHIPPFQKSNCAIALFKVQKKCDFEIYTFLHICSFWKSDCAIALFHTFSKSDKKHNYTFLKSDKMCDRKFAHL